jgi:tetratricopeptide (TPR) repeat protein
LLAALALGGLWAGIHFARTTVRPQLPGVATNGFEPIVAVQIEKALADVRLSPRSGKAWGRLGVVLQAHDLEPEARHCFAQAERFDRNEPRWPYLHGLLLRQVDVDRALARWQRAAVLCPDQPGEPHLRLAQALFQAGRFDEAERYFRWLLQANTDHALARLGLAEVSHARVQLEAARDRLQSCLTNAFTAKRAHTLLGQVESQLGHKAESAAAVRTAASLPPDRTWPDRFFAEAAQYRIGRKAWADQAQQWLEQGQTSEAQTLITRLVNDYPEAPEAWLLLARLRLGQNNCADAEAALRKLLRLAPESVNGYAQLGIALLCLERYSEAVATFQKVIELKPDFGEAHFNLGFAQARAGRGADAIESFRQAIRFSPNFLTPYITLADLLSQTGQKDEARALLRRAAQLDPADERPAILLRRLGQP